MKCLRFFFSLIRGPPTNKGVFTGSSQPRKNALFLFGGVAERLLHPAVTRKSHDGIIAYSQSRWACGFKSHHPRHCCLSIHLPGLAELADALGLGPSWGCPVGRSPSPCEFKSRAPDHPPCTTPVIFPSSISFY